MSGKRKVRGTRRSEGEWRVLLGRFGHSGLGVEAFCHSEAISVASFYRWRGILGGGPRQGGEAGSVPAFVDLGPLESNPHPRPRLELKLDLGDGLTLHLVRG